jgi:hypothetical protein
MLQYEETHAFNKKKWDRYATKEKQKIKEPYKEANV